MPHITQIAAMEISSREKPISLGAQQTTGIVYSGGFMSVQGSQVPSVDIQSTLEKFCHWFKQLKNVILVAHNGRKFDFLVLLERFRFHTCTGTSTCTCNICVKRHCDVTTFRVFISLATRHKLVEVGLHVS